LGSHGRWPSGKIALWKVMSGSCPVSSVAVAGVTNEERAWRAVGMRECVMRCRFPDCDEKARLSRWRGWQAGRGGKKDHFGLAPDLGTPPQAKAGRGSPAAGSNYDATPGTGVARTQELSRPRRCIGAACRWRASRSGGCEEALGKYVDEKRRMNSQRRGPSSCRGRGLRSCNLDLSEAPWSTAIRAASRAGDALGKCSVQIGAARPSGRETGACVDELTALVLAVAGAQELSVCECLA